MTPQEIYPYIFVPGLSTAAALSEVSGRGVGMDIVRNTVQKLKGTINVDSEKDKGTTFTIRLPLTLAVTRALMVIAGNEQFAIPMQSVIQIARVERTSLDTIGSQTVVRINDHAYPLVRLADQLLLREADDESPTIPVLIVRSGDSELAIHVERIIAGRDIVVKTLGSHLRSVNGLIGATLLGDGTVVPILDPNAFSGESEEAFIPKPMGRAGGRGDVNVMIVDDSVSVRRVMENLVKANGWKPTVAKDGVDAIEVLQTQERLPDIFLLDVEMPRMDGYELLSSLRGMPETKDIPVVMVTSRAGEKHRQKAFSLGATDYLVKPYQDEDLVALVKQLTSETVLG
jgi:chemosensory pili system protein ChpA (sensor histidine kinase/response regulator)